MVIGIIYKYTSPSGKVYIGQTTNERHRRSTWFCSKYKYAGVAINRARAKYGPENFIYEVIHKEIFLNKKEATQKLDELETYYIQHYNSYKNGYNNTFGGSVGRGIVKSKESIEKQRKALLGRKQPKEEIERRRKSLKGIKHSKEATENSKRLRRTSGRLKKIGQYDLKGRLIKVWSCVAEIAESLNIIDKNVYRATNTRGKYKGFYWRNFSGEVKIDTVKVRKNSKPVLQFTLQGIFIKEYKSLTEAAIHVLGHQANISKCCRKDIKSAYGYVWKFK